MPEPPEIERGGAFTLTLAGWVIFVPCVNVESARPRLEVLGGLKGGALLRCGDANLAELSVPLNRQTTCWIG